MGVPSVDRRIVEGAIHRRITESRIKKFRFQNIQKNIAGRSTASQLGVLFDWRTLFTLP
jgi:hypothetical protein